MTALQMYAHLVKLGLSPIGACAMLGNMQAKSALLANNVQDGMINMSDSEYTARVDNGTYQRFVSDSVGYGLCQWTYGARKQNLLSFARAQKKSIGDAEMQLEFCYWELQNEYSNLLKYLRSATNLYEATSRICKEYERPAVNNITVRASFANNFYCQFGGCNISNLDSVLPPTSETTPQINNEDSKETNTCLIDCEL